MNVHHTLKVLRSRVTFVRRNSAARFTLRDMYLDMKVGSCVLPVKVQLLH